MPPFVGVLDLEIALTALRVKPFTLVDTFTPILLRIKRLAHLVQSAGLATVKINEHTCIFDPELVAPIISKGLNRSVAPEDTAKGIIELIHHDHFPHTLMGYPEQFSPGTPSYRFSVESRGVLSWPVLFYAVNELACAVYDRQIGLVSLVPYASAAALIEDIRATPSRIYTRATLTDLTAHQFRGEIHISDLKLFPNATVTVTRSGNVGGWDLQLVSTLQ